MNGGNQTCEVATLQNGFFGVAENFFCPALQDYGIEV
jgi:hypothetical protein